MMYLSRVRLRPEIGQTQLARVLEDRQYGLHRLFWDLFSDGKADRQRRTFLFREELTAEQLPRPGKRKADPLYYVLSKEKPTENALFSVDVKPYNPKLAVGDRLSFKLRVNAVVTRNGKRHDIVMDAQNSWLNAQLKAIGQTTDGAKGKRKQRLLDHAGDKKLEQWRADIETGRFSQKLEQSLGRSALMEWAIKTSEAERVQKWWERQGMERHGFEIVQHPKSGLPLFEYTAYLNHSIPEKGKSAGFSSLDLSGEVVVTDVERFNRLLLEGTGPAKAFGCGLMLVRRV
ncbi:MAG: type I-E CRISPR-associated protein Cas6/Cse3/CasE [Candidatus Marinimicrobia bacterium]|nr:type I-E CRISPR-associated protein Cas6/Cse3/CasE [Candidatus Neomarinimicrobiota bacterium]MCF7851037.1 type I-E CRISPR-associated protein Cas6/Cse3/CasE [Candidatus Neomarinimicrobiota bacterium]